MRGAIADRYPLTPLKLKQDVVESDWPTSGRMLTLLYTKKGVHTFFCEYFSLFLDGIQVNYFD